MEPLSSVLVLLVSLTGIGFGIILSYLAPEELAAGKKYLLLAKKAMAGIIALLAVYASLAERTYLFVLIPIAALTLSNMFIESSGPFKKSKAWRYELGYYFLFTGAYFLILNENVRLLIAAIIFIYGLPAGTLMRTRELAAMRTMQK